MSGVWSYRVSPHARRPRPSHGKRPERAVAETAVLGWLFRGRRHASPDAERASELAGAPGEEGREHRLRRVEAVLFLAREPLNLRKLTQYANLADATEARLLIRRLNEWYDEDGSAFRAELVAGGYQLMTRPQFANWLRRLTQDFEETGPPPEVDFSLGVDLSPPAMETLAVIAYRQPVLRSEVEAIRGVNCGEIIRQLMEKDLVKISGRSEELGRPYYYATTARFLRAYGLQNLKQLPMIETSPPAADDAKTT